jgi:hypothetical protein
LCIRMKNDMTVGINIKGINQGHKSSDIFYESNQNHRSQKGIRVVIIELFNSLPLVLINLDSSNQNWIATASLTCRPDSARVLPPCMVQ